jgi:hypothetical protein
MHTDFQRRIITWMIVVLLCGSNAPAQTGGPGAQGQAGDWQAVQNLKPGKLIRVKARGQYYCHFEQATEDQLECKTVMVIAGRPSSVTIPRGEIREVRLEHSLAKHAWVGAGIGAGVGAAVGAGTAEVSPGFGAFVGGLAGVALGAFFGSLVSVFRRGKTIYKQ